MAFSETPVFAIWNHMKLIFFPLWHSKKLVFKKMASSETHLFSITAFYETPVFAIWHHMKLTLFYITTFYNVIVLAFWQSMGLVELSRIHLPTRLKRGTTVHETGNGPISTKNYRSKINQREIQLRRRWGSSAKNMPKSVIFTVRLRGVSRSSWLFVEEIEEIFVWQRTWITLVIFSQTNFYG